MDRILREGASFTVIYSQPPSLSSENELREFFATVQTSIKNQNLKSGKITLQSSKLLHVWLWKKDFFHLQCENVLGYDNWERNICRWRKCKETLKSLSGGEPLSTERFLVSHCSLLISRCSLLNSHSHFSLLKFGLSLNFSQNLRWWAATG